MLDNSFILTIDTEDITLTRVNQDTFTSQYFGESETVVSGASVKLDLSVKHTIPARAEQGESHLVRLDATVLQDYAGAESNTTSVWMVIKTTDGAQNTAFASQLMTALRGLATTAIVDRIIGRES